MNNFHFPIKSIQTKKNAIRAAIVRWIQWILTLDVNYKAKFGGHQL